MFEKSLSVYFTTLATEKLLRENGSFGIWDRAPESYLEAQANPFQTTSKVDTATNIKIDIFASVDCAYLTTKLQNLDLISDKLEYALWRLETFKIQVLHTS